MDLKRKIIQNEPWQNQFNIEEFRFRLGNKPGK
jgi:hypothetical protein